MNNLDKNNLDKNIIKVKQFPVSLRNKRKVTFALSEVEFIALKVYCIKTNLTMQEFFSKCIYKEIKKLEKGEK